MLRTFRQNPNSTARLPIDVRALAIDYPQEPVTRPNGIRIHQWRLCVAGDGELVLRGRRYPLYPGICYLLLAGEPHSYRGTGGDFRMDAVGFGGEASLTVLRSLRFPESGVYRFSEPKRFRDQLQALISGKTARDPGALSIGLYGLLLDIARSVRAVPGPSAGDTLYQAGFVTEMISYMEYHCGQPLSLDDMSERFGRTREYICTVFKRETGISFVDFLTRVRIFQARTLLLDHPEMKISQVAERCGFSSASYFGAVFKKDVGVSPGMFRLTGRR